MPIVKNRAEAEALLDGDAQTLFDYIVAHLESMTCQSMSEVGCAYRGEEGGACAVGCLVDNETYAKFGDKIEEQDSIEVVSILSWPNKHERLLYDLQQDVHDGVDNWNDAGLNDEGRKRLSVIAKEYNLTYKETP